jgi:hypothetical protein
MFRRVLLCAIAFFGWAMTACAQNVNAPLNPKACVDPIQKGPDSCAAVPFSWCTPAACTPVFFLGCNINNAVPPMQCNQEVHNLGPAMVTNPVEVVDNDPGFVADLVSYGPLCSTQNFCICRNRMGMGPMCDVLFPGINWRLYQYTPDMNAPCIGGGNGGGGTGGGGGDTGGSQGT